MKKYQILLLSFLLFRTLNATVILNEVMFNPSGNEYHDEFVEIYNNSAAAVDLNGWQVGDQNESDGLLALTAGTPMVLAPFAYAIILDSSYPANSHLYDQIIPDGVLKLTINDGSFGKSGFSNTTADSVILRDNENRVIDRMQYSIDQDGGYSDERNSFNQSVWQNSKILLGTPGKKNSVVPADYDLALMLKLQNSNSATMVSAKIKNNGLKPVSGFHLEIYAGEQIIQQYDHGVLNAADSVEYLFNTPAQSGSSLISGRVETELDENLLNNRDSLICFNQLQANSLRLNEFMKKPAAGNCEWVEIYNNSTDSINTNDLAFRDLTSSLLNLGSNKIIAPGEYLVIAKDSTILNRYAISESKLLYLKTLPALSDEDALYICDKQGNIIDSLRYSNQWTEDYDQSIEKINPQLATENLVNWVPSVKVATPGGENSVFQPLGTTDSENEVSLNNQLVSPNEDGKNDQLLVNYRFSSPYIYLDATVFNLKGHAVSQILDHAYLPSKGSFVYDCRSKNGSLLAMGSFILFLSAKNSENKTIDFKKVFYIVK